ncbi:MAG: DUF1573 domain-containing protein [Bacteroidales bacterium]|jgi:hypothetical protein|nr:DUF1573 domain-containing protein [Bacteroidales bacterium]
MKKIGFTLWIVLLGLISVAQPKIQFDQTTYDFGTIKEEGGRQTGRFEFTNVGDSALLLTQVKPSCGCTAADYTKTAVEPGGRGFIDATYNPSGRPGPISKSIRVFTNEPRFQENNAAPHIVSIKGTVAKRPPTVFEVAGYKAGNGMTRIKEPNVRFTLKNTEAHLDTITLKNFWNKPVTVEYEKMPEYITETYRSFGGAIQPGKEEIIVFKYDASKRNGFGNINDHIILKTNDSLENNKVLAFNVTIREDFSNVNPKKMPKAVFLANTIELGEMQPNGSKEVGFTITNEGKSPLIIRDVAPNTSAMRITTKTATIEAGQSMTFPFTYKAPNRNGTQKGTIEIITNDPGNEVIILNYTANVKK